MHWLATKPRSLPEGVGGSRVKILLCDNLIGSEKLEYILPGTFNRIEKAFLLAEILCRKVGTYAQFSGYSCRKYPKKMDFQNIRKLTTFGQNSQTWPFFAKLQTKINQKSVRNIFSIFSFSDFWLVLGQIF